MLKSTLYIGTKELDEFVYLKAMEDIDKTVGKRFRAIDEVLYCLTEGYTQRRSLFKTSKEAEIFRQLYFEEFMEYAISGLNVDRDWDFKLSEICMYEDRLREALKCSTTLMRYLQINQSNYREGHMYPFGEEQVDALKKDMKKWSENSFAYDTAMMIADWMDVFAEDYDFYDYRDKFDENECNVEEIANDIRNGDTEGYIEYLNAILQDTDLSDGERDQIEMINRNIKDYEFRNNILERKERRLIII